MSVSAVRLGLAGSSPEPWRACFSHYILRSCCSRPPLSSVFKRSCVKPSVLVLLLLQGLVANLQLPETRIKGRVPSLSRHIGGIRYNVTQYWRC